MAFADPITITYNGASKTLARIETSGTRSVYQTNDGVFKLTISHQVTGSGANAKLRSNVRLDQNVTVVDPLTGESLPRVVSDYRVLERPLQGVAITVAEYMASALNGWFIVGNVDKLYGRES